MAPPDDNDDKVSDPNGQEIIVTARRRGSGWGFTGVYIDGTGYVSEPFPVAELSPGDVPDIVEWTSPTQVKKNGCASETINITVSGGQVTITGTISFQGAGAGSHTDMRLLSGLNSAWTGQFGDYAVTTNMTIGSGGLIANVSGSPLGQQSAELGGPNIWTLTLDGASEAGAEFTIKKFAHEFGHSLGLMNLYDENGGPYAPGYENNIMSDVNAKPSWQNIRDILNQGERGCSEVN